MYPGTHPRGTQNKALLANQNCKKKRRPLVRDQRKRVAMRSKVAREVCSVDASDAPMDVSQYPRNIESSHCSTKPEGVLEIRTQVINPPQPDAKIREKLEKTD